MKQNRQTLKQKCLTVPDYLGKSLTNPRQQASSVTKSAGDSKQTQMYWQPDFQILGIDSANAVNVQNTSDTPLKHPQLRNCLKVPNLLLFMHYLLDRMLNICRILYQICLTFLCIHRYTVWLNFGLGMPIFAPGFLFFSSFSFSQIFQNFTSGRNDLTKLIIAMEAAFS